MKRLLLKLITLYKKDVSGNLGARCRFVPTCSTYAYEAIEKHGAFIGSILAVTRFLRCNPLFRGGYDPVPDRLFSKNKD